MLSYFYFHLCSHIVFVGNLAENVNSSFCETCRQINGLCYYAEVFEGTKNKTEK